MSGGEGDWPLLLALGALLAAVAATASAMAQRRARRAAEFLAGMAVACAATVGLAGLGVLLLAGPEGMRRVAAVLRGEMAPLVGHLPLPNIVRPTPRPEPPASAPMPARPGLSQSGLAGVVTWVRDGDTIEVAGVPVRFAAVDCAERGTAEGDRATAALRRLAAGKHVECRLIGRRSYDREVGTCFLDGRDLGMALVAQGLCRRRW